MIRIHKPPVTGETVLRFLSACRLRHVCSAQVMQEGVKLSQSQVRKRRHSSFALMNEQCDLFFRQPLSNTDQHRKRRLNTLSVVAMTNGAILLIRGLAPGIGCGPAWERSRLLLVTSLF